MFFFAARDGRESCTLSWSVLITIEQGVYHCPIWPHEIMVHGTSIWTGRMFLSLFSLFLHKTSSLCEYQPVLTIRANTTIQSLHRACIHEHGMFANRKLSWWWPWWLQNEKCMTCCACKQEARVQGSYFLIATCHLFDQLSVAQDVITVCLGELQVNVKF